MMQLEYSIVFREPGNSKLGFVKIVTPVENLFDFCSMLQEQMKKGVIPLDATVVNIGVSDIIEEEAQA